MRKLQYYVASSIDGFVSGLDDSVDGFLGEGAFVDEFLAYQRQVGVVLMGRNTYDFGVRLGVTNPYPHLAQYVFSRTLSQSPDPAITLVREDAIGRVRALKAQPGPDIWLCGAGLLAAELLRAGLIDELMLKLNPLLFGPGKPLFAGEYPKTKLQLAECRPYENGVVFLRYLVLR